jgi:Holliday junction resolvase
MNCFLHQKKEAVTTCSNCGNTMCSECLAYGGEKGICLECKRKELEAELIIKRKQLKKITWLIALVVVILVAVFVTLIGALIFTRILFSITKKRTAIKERTLYLETEIARIEEALRQHRLPKRIEMARVHQERTYLY